jgi:transcriptional antiterminator
VISKYPIKNLQEEIAFIAYHFNWSKEEVLDMSHKERQSWAKEISGINERINKAD